jgi:hypothetical protein
MHGTVITLSDLLHLHCGTKLKLSKPKAKYESSTCRTATFGPIPGLQKTLELRETIFSPEMIWEQESKEALATWVLVQIYTQSSFLCLYVLAYFSL